MEVTRTYVVIVRTPRAKQSWLQYLVETHRSLNLERQVEALAELAQSIIGRISDNNLLVYLPRIMNYSYGMGPVLMILVAFN